MRIDPVSLLPVRDNQALRPRFIIYIIILAHDDSLCNDMINHSLPLYVTASDRV